MEDNGVLNERRLLERYACKINHEDIGRRVLSEVGKGSLILANGLIYVDQPVASDVRHSTWQSQAVGEDQTQSYVAVKTTCSPHLPKLYTWQGFKVQVSRHDRVMRTQ